MSKKANPAVVGSFVLGAIVLSIIGIMLLGGASMFEKKFDCILYFDESISGLDVGAPVDFQGVRIGTVTDVRIQFDKENNNEVLRPVRMQIEGNRIHLVRKNDEERDPAKNMESLVQDQGVRARLAAQSMLTGKLKIELGFFPNQPIVRKNRDQDIWEMPTVASPLKKVTEEVAELPLSEIVNEVHRAVKGMADILNPDKTGKAIQNMNLTLERLGDVLARVESKIDPMAEQGSKVMKTAQVSLEEMHQVLVKIDAEVEPLLKSMTKISTQLGDMMDPESSVRGEVADLMEDLRETSKSLRRLSDYIEQHPESLLRGKK
jgi:paraquat-inducible protein B